MDNYSRPPIDEAAFMRVMDDWDDHLETLAPEQRAAERVAVIAGVIRRLTH